METQVKQIIAQVLNVELDKITDDLSAGDIPEWDSVGNLAIISIIEQESIGSEMWSSPKTADGRVVGSRIK